MPDPPSSPPPPLRSTNHCAEHGRHTILHSPPSPADEEPSSLMFYTLFEGTDTTSGTTPSAHEVAGHHGIAPHFTRSQNLVHTGGRGRREGGRDLGRGGRRAGRQCGRLRSQPTADGGQLLRHGPTHRRTATVSREVGCAADQRDEFGRHSAGQRPRARRSPAGRRRGSRHGARSRTRSAGPDRRACELLEPQARDLTGRKQASESMRTPYNGLAEAQHIGAVHAFLVSAANARMTGQVIFVDGGFDTMSRGDDIWQRPNRATSANPPHRRPRRAGRGWSALRPPRGGGARGPAAAFAP